MSDLNQSGALIVAGPKALVVILHRGTLARMQKADPFELDLATLGLEQLPTKLAVAYVDDLRELQPLIDAGDTQAIFDRVCGGFKFKPELGDHDDGPVKLEPLL